MHIFVKECIERIEATGWYECFWYSYIFKVSIHLVIDAIHNERKQKNKLLTF